MIPRAAIRDQLRQYQKRLQLGDALPPIPEIARRAGVHRDTVYAALNGDRLCDRTWRQLYNALEQLRDIIQATPSRVLAVQFTSRGATIKPGLGQPLLQARRLSER